MKTTAAAVVIILAVFGGIGWWLRVYQYATNSTLVALGAVAFSCIAAFQAYRSAQAATKTSALAQLNEERAKFRWEIDVHPDGDRYVLRNRGTVLAHDVKLAADECTFIGFENHEGDVGPDIEPGHSKAFYARYTMMSAPGNEVQIDWLPEGEKTRKRHSDVLEPIPNKQFEETVKRRQVERDAEEVAHRQLCVEIRNHLVDLADAWGAFQSDASVRNKARVQALVSALPSNMVREIGFAVDVPRDHWGPQQWPLEIWAFEENDKPLVRENAAMIELMWNLTWVQIPPIVEADISQSPRPWYRIEDAVHGYIALVRSREKGEPTLIDGPRDRKAAQEAKRDFEAFSGRFEAQKQRNQAAQQTTSD